MRCNSCKFRHRKSHIQRHQDGARLRHSEITFPQLMCVEAQKRNAVALLRAQRLQRRSEPPAALTQLFESESLFPANDAYFLRKYRYCPLKASQWGQWWLHLPNFTALMPIPTGRWCDSRAKNYFFPSKRRNGLRRLTRKIKTRNGSGDRVAATCCR